ncbi:MAG TPA: PAN domain-containing protein, partial [Devosia sp.]|nr:PAN domain-containing protein [Devosia sp.]
MRGLVRSAAWLLATLVFILSISAVDAAQRSVTLLPNTDMPGGDYNVIKNTTINGCQTACTGDGICGGFTFNTKTKWCFLKGVPGTQSPFTGATSGLIVTNPSAADLAKARTSDLPFPASDLIDSANDFATDLPTNNPPPKGLAYPALVKAGDDAMGQANSAGAMVSYQQALATNPNDPGVWLKLANAALAGADAAAAANPDSGDNDTATTASYAALEGFLKSEAVPDRATLLGALAHALELRQMYRESIVTYRASLALVDDTTLQARLDKVVAQHGFRVASNQVDAESATPQICAVFSDPLPAKQDLSGYVVVDDAPQVAVSVSDTQICITGVEHGKRYHVKLRAGLPSADGETLRSDVDLNVYVPDRKPFVGFANNAYVMPAGLGGGLPITAVNAKSADVTVYRIGDRSIATAVRNGVFQGTLSNSTAEDIANQYGDKLWSGTVDLAQGAPNAETTTAIPVGDVLKGIAPGAYVATATVTGEVQSDDYSDVATQWFIVSDLGLTTISGDDGLHA